MNAIIEGWVRSLTGAAVLCAMAFALCPKGRSRRVLRLAAGCVMAIALLSPAASPGDGSFSEAFARYGEAARELTESAGEAAEAYERRVIQERCEAYIMDRADALGVELTEASVELRWSSEGFWYPYECGLKRPGGYESRLAGSIEAGLGVPAARQRWEESE